MAVMVARAVLLDVDGVLVVSWKPIPGAIDAVGALRAAALPVLFVTNTTSRTRADVARSLREAGFTLDDSELFTAGVATAAYLAEHHPGARCLVYNEGPLDDLAGIRIVGDDDDARPDVVVVGSAGPSFTWEMVNRATRAVIGGAELVAMHGTATWRTAGGICVDGGAYVAALERATGRVAITVGKPAAPMFEAALHAVGVDARDAVMVGDDLGSDVLAAQALGIRGVLVRTGKFRDEILRDAPETPDAVIDSVADLPGWLGLGGR
jgi:HAD superfamily hydrolase (TIGR01458 family)